jgi:hypothetical protein
MFDSLERPPDEPLARHWPILFYGLYCLVGLESFSLDVLRHHFAHPVALAVSCVMFFLSLTWLVTTLKSRSPLTNRSIRFPFMVLIVLFGFLQYLRM